MHTHFSPTAMVLSGWETFKSRSLFFIGAYVLAGLIFWIVSGVASSLAPVVGEDAPLRESFTLLGIISMILSVGINMLYSMGTTSFALKADHSARTVTLSDLWCPRPFWKYVWTNILYTVIVTIGFILLIIPGIIASLMFGFAMYLVIDKNMSPEEALSESRRITNGHKWDLLLLGLLILGINIVGFLALIVGLLVSLPVSMLAMVHAYRTLAHGAHA